MNFIIGIILIAAGVYLLFFFRKKNGNALLDIQATQTSTVAEVAEQINAMAEYDQDYRELVELKGFAKCSNPPTTPFSNKQVAFYTAATYQVSEETRQERDSNGNMRTRTVKHEDKISEEESGEELVLTDTEGNSIIIETNGLADKLDLVKTLDRFEPADRYNNGGYYENRRRRYRSFDIGPMGAGYRMLGYKQVERIFALNAKLYVLGEAYMNCGQLTVGPPRDKSKSFIVTTKSEEELVSAKKRDNTLSLVGGILCIVIGIVAFFAGN